MRSRSSEEEDYVLRLISRAGEALARLRERLMGTGSAAEFVQQDAEIAVRELLGSSTSLLQRLDAESAVQLIGHPERVALWAALMDVQADAANTLGDTKAADSLRKRAMDVRTAAHL